MRARESQKTLLVATVCLIIMLVGSMAHSCRKKTIDVGDKAVLIGTVTTKLVWGPPNFGEDPLRDSKGQIFVLLLKHKITIRGSGSALYKGARGQAIIKEIQLWGDDSLLTRFKGKKVEITGIVQEATAPMERLPFVLDVETIVLAK